MPSRRALTRYVALLRGINVGGKNMIRMPALRACFEEQGFGDVATYIASGNVLFSASAGARALTRGIEETLAATFGYPASIVLRSRKQMQEVVEGAPQGFGARPKEYRYDVWFLKEPLSADEAVESVPTREGVDRIWGGGGVLYVSRLAARAAESRVTRVIGKPIYQSLTIRNWNTTTKLLALLERSG
jgi:uncharacterized protein (DUF1697 family)